MGLQPELGLRS
jgi:signal transduction histidine kinase